MKFKVFLDMYDDWNGTTKVNDDNLNCIVKARTMDIGFNDTDTDYSYLYDKEVVAFGFYDGELCIRVK